MTKAICFSTPTLAACGLGIVALQSGRTAEAAVFAALALLGLLGTVLAK
jgi:hypothetical protein